MKKLIFTIYYSFESSSMPPMHSKQHIRTRHMTRRLRPLEENMSEYEFKSVIVDEAVYAFTNNLKFIHGGDSKITIHNVTVDLITQITVRD